MIFFTSDHHFDHANIIKYCNRPFLSVDEMNEEIVKRWNQVVDANDTVYYLGDFSLGKGSVEKFVPRLNGEKYLVMGNHDACTSSRPYPPYIIQPIPPMCDGVVGFWCRLVLFSIYR
jgi:calcineurin-like phosphoesterase family protein